MKAFIIYVSVNKKSKEYANYALKSFNNKNGWQPELFSGITPNTLFEFEEKYPIKTKLNSRAMIFWKTDKKRYYVKKSCSMNHYRLFKKCIELDKPISIIEQDSYCISDWNNVDFNDILLLNIQSAIEKHPSGEIRRGDHQIKDGLNDLNMIGMNYRHDPKLSHGIMIPGTAAYAITPIGAKKMINIYENIGWEQSDFIINTAYVNIQTIVPELFTFKLPNLQMSHGINL